MKIAIIPDTNALYTQNTPDISKLNLKEYDKILKIIEDNSLQNQIKLLIPELVLIEWIKHYKDHLKNEIDNLKTAQNEFKNFNEINIDMDNINIEKYSNQLLEYYREKFDIIEMPENKPELFEEILEMAIQKYPPFKKGDSDQGFKDAIIFKSIKKYSEENDFEKYVIISTDKGFIDQSKKLNKNFDNGEIEVISHKEINSYIIKNFKLYGEIEEILESKLYEKIIDIYQRASMIEINQEYKWIRTWDLKESETEINKINENEFEVEIPILIEMDTDNDFPFLFTEHIMQKEKFTLTKKEDIWRFFGPLRKYNVIYWLFSRIWYNANLSLVKMKGTILYLLISI